MRSPVSLGTLCLALIAAAGLIGCSGEGEPAFVPELPQPPDAPDVPVIPSDDVSGRHGTAVRALLRADDRGVTLLDAVVVNEQVASTPGELLVLDAEGRELASARVPDARLHSIIAPPEDGGGGEAVLLDEETFEVLVPWPRGARTVTLGDVRIEDPERQEPPEKDGELQVEAIQVSGPSSERFDLVILGDGYTEEDLDLFAPVVDRIVEHLNTVEPYASYGDMLNVWSAVRPSNESGGGRAGRAQDTAYGCYYGCQGTDRLLCCDSGRVRRDAQEAVPSMNAVIVVVNDDKYGGAGSVAYGTTYSGTWAPRVAVHEMGHVFGLLDEYDYGFEGTLRSPSPNCAADAAATPWEPWRVRPDVDAFPTCSFRNAYRPTDDGCLMHLLEVVEYCPVCLEHVLLHLYETVGGPIVGASPEPDWVHPLPLGQTPMTFEIFAVGPDDGALDYVWTLDGEVLDATGAQAVLDACALGADTGVHDLEVVVVDPTGWIRSDWTDRVTASQLWWITGSTACGGVEPDDPSDPDEPDAHGEPDVPDDAENPDGSDAPDDSEPGDGEWQEAALAIESDHDYANYTRATWTVTAPEGTTAFRIHFSRIDVESGYDFVEVYDAEGTQIHQYTGDLGEVLTDVIPGSTAEIRLVTDYSVTRWGFAVDGMQYRSSADGGEGGGEPDRPLEWTPVAVDAQSEHPYRDLFDGSWTVEAPDGASELRLHFARIDVEPGYDYVEVYDGNGDLVDRWDGLHEDFTTPAFAGPTARVRLVTDYSVTRWGFQLDRIEVR